MRRIVVIFLVIFLWVTQGVAKDKIVYLATLNWKPYVGNDLQHKGFTSQIVIEAFKRAGYTVEIAFKPWARVLKEVDKGKYDAAYPAYYSDERAAKYSFSHPFSKSMLGFYKRKKDKITFKTLHDLKPYKIGVVRGYVNPPDFDKSKYLKKEKANSDEENIRKLIKRRLDMIVIDKIVAQYIVNNSYPKWQDELEFMEPALEGKHLYVMFSKHAQGFEQKLKDFNAALKEMIQDGTVKKIMLGHGFK